MATLRKECLLEENSLILDVLKLNNGRIKNTLSTVEQQPKNVSPRIGATVGTESPVKEWSGELSFIF